MPDGEAPMKQVDDLIDLLTKGESAFRPEKVRYTGLLNLSLLAKEKELQNNKLKREVEKLRREVERLSSEKSDFQSSIHELLAMQRVSEAIQVAKDPDSVLTALLGLLRQFLEFTEYGLYSSNRELFRGDFTDDFGAPGLKGMIEGLEEEGIMEWAISERNPIVIPGTQIVNPEDGNGGSFVILPLSSTTIEPGVIVLQTEKRSEDFSAQDIELLSILTNHAAIAIENTWLTRETTNTKIFLESLIESSPNPIVATDERNIITLYNAAMEEFLGLQADDMVGKKVSVMVEGGEENLESFQERLKKDGRIVGEQINLLNKASEQRPVLVMASSFDVDDGRQKGFLWLCEDLQKRIDFESERMKSEKLELLYKTAVSVNHEINNPLTIIIGNLKLLAKLVPKDDKKLQILTQSAMEAGKRIEDVTQRLSNVKNIEYSSYGEGTQMLKLEESSENV